MTKEWPSRFPYEWPTEFGDPNRPGGAATPWWLAAGVTPDKAYSAIGVGGLAASYVNLVNPGVENITLGAAGVSLTATGWQSDGVGYLILGANPPAKDGTLILRFYNNNIVAPQGIMGLYESATVAFLFRPVSGSLQHWCANVVTNFPNMVSGAWGMTNGVSYRNGVVEAAASTPNGDPTVPMYALRYNQGGPTGTFDGQIASIWYADQILSAEEMALQSAAMP